MPPNQVPMGPPQAPNSAPDGVSAMPVAPEFATAPIGSQPVGSETAAAPIQGQPAPGTKQPAPQQKPANQNSTQNTLLISEIRDNMVIMKDGSFRAVVACKSINFDLMSSREREGIEYSYQNFLNSLYFPVQIFIRSQRVDIGPYIDKLIKIRRDQDNMLLGILTEDYVNFIAALAEETSIMDKQFYIVVPYYPAGDVNAIVQNSKNIFSALFGGGDKQQHIRIDQTAYSKAKEEISNRVNAVLSGLFQMGVRGSQLDTKQLAELYYNVYNPDTAVREPLKDFENSTSTFVQRAQGPSPASPNGVQG